MPYGAQLLMGQAVEYEVGNVFDPAYTMICKMRKEHLVRLGMPIASRAGHPGNPMGEGQASSSSASGPEGPDFIRFPEQM